MLKLELLKGTERYDLTDAVDYVLQAFDNLALPPLTNLTERGPYQVGATLVGTRIEERRIPLTVHTFAEDEQGYWERRAELARLLTPYDGTLTLRLRRDGFITRCLDVVYDGGLTLSSAERRVFGQLAAFTLLAPRVRRAMESSGAGIGDLFDGAQPAGGRAAPSAGRQGAQLEAFGEKVRETFSGIRPDLAAVDPELPGALDTAERKILHNIGRLIGRLDRTGSPAGFWRHHCLPNGRLQERELGIAYFLSLLGPSVLDTIRSGIRTGDFSHRVLSLGL